MAARPGIENCRATPGQGHPDLRWHIYFPGGTDVQLQFLQPRDTGSLSDIPAEGPSVYTADGWNDCHHRKRRRFARWNSVWNMVRKNRTAAGDCYRRLAGNS